MGNTRTRKILKNEMITNEKKATLVFLWSQIKCQIWRRRNSGIFYASLFKFTRAIANRTEVRLANHLDVVLFPTRRFFSFCRKAEVQSVKSGPRDRPNSSGSVSASQQGCGQKLTWGKQTLLQGAWFPCTHMFSGGHSKPAGVSSGLNLAHFPGSHMWLLCCRQWQGQNKSTWGFGLSCICCFVHCLNLITLATLDNGQQVEACLKQPSELAPTFGALLQGLRNCPTFSQAKTFHFSGLSKTNKPAEAVSSMQLDRFLKGKQ